MNATTRALNPELFPPSAEKPLAEPETTLRTNRANDGRAFQKEIEATAGGYKARDMATLRKVDPPVRVIWIDDKQNPGRKRQHVIFMENPWLDFAGVWTAHGGRALFVEAKSGATHRLKINGSGGINPSQMAAIKQWRMGGAATCVLFRWGGRVALFTPEILLAAEGRGDKSVTFESGLPVERGEGTIIWDFLATLERALWPR